MPEPAPIPILNLRGFSVLIDADLACLYGVPTKRLNEQVRRNYDRFPGDFLFALTPEEKAEVVANCDHLQNLKFSKALPHAFTEHGALMAANVLNSPDAVKMSVFTCPEPAEGSSAPSSNNAKPSPPTRPFSSASPRSTKRCSSTTPPPLNHQLSTLNRPRPRPRIGFGKQDDR